MPASKVSTRSSFGRRSRWRKPRGRSAALHAKDGDPSPPAPSSPSPPSPSPSSSSSAALRTSEPTASSPNAHRLPVSSESDVLTTFEKKLGLLDFDAGTTDDPEPTDAPVEKPLDGYRLLSVSAVQTLVAALLCPKCHGELLSLREEGIGVNLQFVVSCSTCGDIVTTPHSPSIGKSTERTRGASRRRWKRLWHQFYEAHESFRGLNAPPPMHVKSYQKIAGKVHDAAMQAASDAMRDAAQAVRDAQPTGSPTAGSDRLDVCISYDGTWHKRGHTSHFGVGVAIELETGLVLDFSVQSKYCHGCELGPKEDDEHFEEWAETHKATCQKNYEGSSNAMEVQAAATIFSRSIELHNMQYVTVLCDGDSKAFTHVSSLDLYDKDIHKEDCVNHVAKRMYAGVEKLKKTKKKLGGKGKLTNVVMKKLTNYYACALKDNAPDVVKMQRAIFASLFHTYSTDEEPRHMGCPDGEDSWCHYNRHKALEAAGKPSTPRPHRPASSKDVARELVPVYNRLSRKELLLRCSRMMTQNANESFNALIWKRCPKTEFASLRTVETAVALAVLEFNLGPKGFERTLQEMGITPGSHQEKHAHKATLGKIVKARVKAQDSSKLAHKRRKLEAIAREQQSLEVEGATYAAGGF
ncbi:hypothetical protein ISCGN_018975 [Ixodes scapularis]